MGNFGNRPILILILDDKVEYMDIKIEYTNQPEKRDTNVLFNGISETVPPGLSPVESFGFFIRDNNGTVIAGASGWIMFGGIYTDLLWVSTELRGQGQGGRLMKAVEDLGVAKHCRFATVNTFNFQALPFYLALNYVIQLERKGYDGAAINYFLYKSL